jgi:alpha-galactosidase
MAIKIAIIGAGSLGFTRCLVHDTLMVPELQDTTFALTDISARNLRMVARLLERDVRANRLPARIVSTTDRRAALAGADYVVNTARVGGLDAFRLDIDVPLKYGVDQCVGDTLCAGGIFYGQRGIACILDWCRDIRAVAKPHALFVNYGNPNAMLVWAANAYGEVPTIGLCHGVQGGHWQISKVIEFLVNRGRQPGDRGFVAVEMKDVDIVCAGINHQTWYIQVQYRGEDWTDRLLEGFERHPEYSRTEKVRIDVLRRFGYYSTESNGHLSEYLAWYRKRPEEIRRWIDMGSWINGETGGYLRVCTEGRNWFETEFPRLLAEKPWDLATARRSHEHGSYIVEALETGRAYRGHVNVVNNGCLTNLAADAVVEVPCYVDRNGLNVPRVGDLPSGCAAICRQSIDVQRLAVEAAVHGDVFRLKQAMLLDPLVGAACTPPEISQMTDEMLVAQARWLPQYRGEVPAAKRRLAAEPRLGTRGTAGAARKPPAAAAAVAARTRRTAARRRAGRKLDIAEPEG